MNQLRDLNAQPHVEHMFKVDHTKLDLFVVQNTGLVISRPWLTVVIGASSKSIFGWWLSPTDSRRQGEA